MKIDVGGQSVEPFRGALDLGDAGQEGKQASLRLAERAAAGGRHFLLDPFLRAAAEVDEVDRMAAAVAFDYRRLAHQLRETGAVEGGRHGQQPEVGPQRALRVERERQSEIAVQAALVHFVEQHGRDAGQLGIRLDALQEDAFGEDEDPGSRRAPAVEPRGIADRLADCLAGQLRHSLGRGARREPARRQEQDLAAAPGLAEQGRRDRRRLARARRRDQDRARAVSQRGLQVRQDRNGWEARSRLLPASGRQ